MQEVKSTIREMDSYNDVSMEDLIDCNADESTSSHRSIWTEQALDLFISNLKNIKKSNFPNQRKMLEIITIKMSQKGYKFTLDQIERKYNSLRKMYTEKKERNQVVEPELSKLFGDNQYNRHRPSQNEQTPAKKPRFENTEEDPNEDCDDRRIIWSPDATKAYLDLLEKLRPQLGSTLPTKKQMWKEICRQLRNQGYNFTHSQIENKWKALLRHYRNRLELLRSGIHRPHYNSWPDMFEDVVKIELKELEARTGLKTEKDLKEQSSITDTERDISFANDQKLPFENDGCTDDETFQFEEALSLPYVEINTEEPDPVLIDEQPSTSSQALERIAKEIATFRQDTREHQNQILRHKKRELEAYRQRTMQFARIAQEFSQFATHFRRSNETL